MENNVLAAVISGILGGGVVSALLTQILQKKKTQADISRVEAETEHLQTQTLLLQKELKGVQSEVNITQEKINTLVKYTLAFYLLEHLSKLYHHDEVYRYDPNPRFERDLRLLRDLGYLELFHIRDLRAGDKLVDKINLTPLGKLLVELREQGEGCK
ncbi:hypothetical protein SAMN05421863_100791 [Nitrosomonas communis]|uniref:Uncharacterized protein n=2 Tax=Nitrosomonas communis TaxID=44574 RepID=A0A1I4LTQ1_9PROT|nr:hypothetical protein SAMN05421863_100791 [Nitrosomonas communis]